MEALVEWFEPKLSRMQENAQGRAMAFSRAKADGHKYLLVHKDSLCDFYTSFSNDLALEFYLHARLERDLFTLKTTADSGLCLINVAGGGIDDVYNLGTVETFARAGVSSKIMTLIQEHEAHFQQCQGAKTAEDAVSHRKMLRRSANTI